MTTNPGLSCSIWLNLFINRNGRKYVWPLETGDLAIDSWSRGDFCASRHNRACEFDLCMRCEKYLPSKPIIAYTPYFVLIACLKLQSWDSYHETPKFERERKKKRIFFYHCSACGQHSLVGTASTFISAANSSTCIREDCANVSDFLLLDSGHCTSHRSYIQYIRECTQHNINKLTRRTTTHCKTTISCLKCMDNEYTNSG